MRFTQKNRITISALAVLLLGGTALLVPVEARANDPVPVFSYAAKTICETETNSNVETKINIHNPRYGNVAFFWKAVEAEEAGATDGLDYIVHQAYLGPDGAAFIDCNTLYDQSQISGEFEGFVVVISRTELDVVSVLDAETGDEVPMDFEINRVSLEVVADSCSCSMRSSARGRVNSFALACSFAVRRSVRRASGGRPLTALKL
jgi:hypothetical protein